ncbi:uroporphyrinogen-III C-methyltransferase [Thiogranum longum]
MNESKQLPTPGEPPAKIENDRPDVDRPRPPASRNGVPLVLALVALGIAIGLAATAYFTWHQVQQLASKQSGIEASLDSKFEPLRSAVKEIDRTVQAERDQTDRALERLGQDLQSMGHRVSVLAALLGRSEQGWSLAEVEYLLRIANQRLQLQRDVVTAGEALKAADERLRDLADPHFLSVREQIARDLESVQAVPELDVAGIAVTLGSSLEAIDQLPVAGTRYEPVASDATTGQETTKTAQNWRELPQVLSSSLSTLFQMREHDKPVGPMLPPEREYFLRENMRMQLSAARLALLRDDPVQFEMALGSALDWLKSYFDQDDERVKELFARLEELAAVNIRPEIPDISGSLRVLRQQVKLSEQQAVLPVVPEQSQPPEQDDNEPRDSSEQKQKEPAS